MEETTIEMLDRGRARATSASFKAVTRAMMLSAKSGGNQNNEPLHAVLSVDLDEAKIASSPEDALIRNRAMLHYIASLAKSNSETDKFNYDFVQSLLDGGGDLNEAVDMHGQTIFHEVARSWNLDVAQFLITNGADVNLQDKYGRSPLHVSSAADHCDMVEFLLQHGAEINGKSFGDEQTPLHFAAKSDAERSLHALLGFGADIDSLDSKGRTALQVASELSRSVAVRVLIEEGASSCLYDINGSSAMTVLIAKLPQLAVEALDQLHLSDRISRCDHYYLNLLEQCRQSKSTKEARTPLETAVDTRQYDVIMHPVMQRLIDVKWSQYGRFGTFVDLGINFVYAILFTVFAVHTPNEGRDMYSPMGENVWRIFVGSIIIAVTSYQMYLQIKSTYRSRDEQKQWIKWRLKQLKDDLQYCHPKWQEEKYVRDEMKIIKNLPLMSTIDAWFFFDWFIIILILVSIGLNFGFYFVGSSSVKSAYVRVLSILLIFVWLRIMKYLRPFPGIGTLVLILGSTGGDFLNWGFFFVLLFVPFTCSFWVLFGARSPTNVQDFDDVTRLIYTMFQISVGEDFNIQGLVEADHVMARLLSSLFITAMVIVCLNILIAYLSNTFTSVYSKAVENTNMQRAINILNIEKFLTKNRLRKFYDYLRQNANPDIVPWSPIVVIDAHLEVKAAKDMQNNFLKSYNVLKERFQKRVGKGKACLFDSLMNDVEKIRAHQLSTFKDLTKIQMALDQLGDALGVDTTTTYNFTDLVTRLVREQRERSASKPQLSPLGNSETGLRSQQVGKTSTERSTTLSSGDDTIDAEENEPGSKKGEKMDRISRRRLGSKARGNENDEVEDLESAEDNSEDEKPRGSKLFSKLKGGKARQSNQDDEDEDDKRRQGNVFSKIRGKKQRNTSYEDESEEEEEGDNKRKKGKVLGLLTKGKSKKYSEDELSVDDVDVEDNRKRKPSVLSKLTAGKLGKQREEGDRDDYEKGVKNRRGKGHMTRVEEVGDDEEVTGGKVRKKGGSKGKLDGGAGKGIGGVSKRARERGERGEEWQEDENDRREEETAARKFDSGGDDEEEFDERYNEREKSSRNSLRRRRSRDDSDRVEDSYGIENEGYHVEKKRKHGMKEKSRGIDREYDDDDEIDEYLARKDHGKDVRARSRSVDRVEDVDEDDGYDGARSSSSSSKKGRMKEGKAAKMFSKVSILKGKRKETRPRRSSNVSVTFRDEQDGEGSRTAAQDRYEDESPRHQHQPRRGSLSSQGSRPPRQDKTDRAVVPYRPPPIDNEDNDSFADEFVNVGSDAWEQISIDSVSL